jgi:hypothetical protein
MCTYVIDAIRLAEDGHVSQVRWGKVESGACEGNIPFLEEDVFGVFDALLKGDQVLVRLPFATSSVPESKVRLAIRPGTTEGLPAIDLETFPKSKLYEMPRF